MGEIITDRIRQLAYPNGVFRARYGGAAAERIRAATVAFVFAHMTSLTIATLLLTASGLDLDTSLSGALTALSNVGPGLGAIIGPSGGFSPLPDAAKATSAEPCCWAAWRS